EAELVVGAVGDVCLVGGPALGGGHLRAHDPDLHTEELVDTTHVLGVSTSQVVVGRDDVDAFACQGVQIDREGTGQGLALTGLHLGDVAEVERGTTHDLHVEVALPQGPLGCLTDGREGLWEQIVQRLSVLVAFLVLLGEVAQLFVGQVTVLLFERVDLILQLVESAQDLSLTRAQELTEYPWHFLCAPCRSRFSSTRVELRPGPAGPSPCEERTGGWALEGPILGDPRHTHGFGEWAKRVLPVLNHNGWKGVECSLLIVAVFPYFFHFLRIDALQWVRAPSGRIARRDVFRPHVVRERRSS